MNPLSDPETHAVNSENLPFHPLPFLGIESTLMYNQIFQVFSWADTHTGTMTESCAYPDLQSSLSWSSLHVDMYVELIPFVSSIIFHPVDL